MRFLIVFLLIATTVIGCKSAPSGRYTQHKDSAPRYVAKTPTTLDAVPKYEPYRLFNNRQYVVLGKRYTPLTSGKGIEQTGYASWYGQKFHGHLTSNGETYNMFAMSAAHKTLPLPSFVRVTNLDNDKQAIVRVNDRGPFHDNRIIDLSYAAAVKLGYHDKGTAKVKIEVIHFDEDNNVTVGLNPTITYDEYLGINVSPTSLASSNLVPANVALTKGPSTDSSSITHTDNPAAPPEVAEGVYIQVAALSDGKRAESISKVLSALYQVPSHTPIVNNMYKLQLGPIVDETAAIDLLEKLKQNGYPQAYQIK